MAHGASAASLALVPLQQFDAHGSRPGTYTYFCRVHPFMRGSFRVKG